MHVTVDVCVGNLASRTLPLRALFVCRISSRILDFEPLLVLASGGGRRRKRRKRSAGWVFHSPARAPGRDGGDERRRDGRETVRLV